MTRKHPLWAWLLGAFFVLAVFDGALRKWVLPSQQLVLYLLKDAVLLVSLGLYWLHGNPIRLPRPAQRHFLALILGLFVYLVLLQAVNLRQPHWAVSVLGLKAHLAYVPLVVLLPAFLAGLPARKAEHYIGGYLAFIALPVLLVGIYQFFQPPGSWVNQYVVDEAHVAGLFGHPRITGTFSYITGMETFLQFNALISFAVLAAGVLYGRRWLRWGGAGFLGLCVTVLPMTGSRSAVVFPALLIVGISLLLAVQKRGGGYTLLLSFMLVFSIAAILFTQTDLVEGWKTFQARLERIGSSDEARIIGVFTRPFRVIGRAGLFGHGAGTLHQAATKLVPGQGAQVWIPGSFVEHGFSSLMMEVGLLGMIVLLALKGTILWMAYRVFSRASTPFETIIGIFALGVTGLHFYFPVAFRATSAVFYWTAAGLVVYAWSMQELRVRHHAVAAESGVVGSP